MRALTLSLVLTLPGLRAQEDPQAFEPLFVEAGPLQLAIHVSPTANLFHLVDQVSEWSEFCHRQYGRWLRGSGGGLDATDRRLLARYAEVRQRYGWGGGLEQSFYTDLDLVDALREGLESERLSRADTATLRDVLLQFEERSLELMDEHRETVLGFRAQIEARLGDLEELALQLQRFTGGAPGRVPAFLIPNPDPNNFGGGYNGGRLTVEIATEFDVWPTFVHELMHAFLASRRGMLLQAAARVDGLDQQTLEEGIAYALAPGILQPDGRDTLAETVRRRAARGETLQNSLYRFHRYGLALRPALRDALGDPEGNLKAFLPRACALWREVLAAEDRRR